MTDLLHGPFGFAIQMAVWRIILFLYCIDGFLWCLQLPRLFQREDIF